MSIRMVRASSLFVAVAPLGALMLPVEPASAQCDESILVPSLGQIGDQFGFSIAVERERLVIGSPVYSASALGDGVTFVFGRHAGSWVEEAILTSPTPIDDQLFGNRVEVQDDTIMVQALRQPDMLPGGSAVFVFEMQAGTWIQTQRLFDADHTHTNHDNFGSDILIQGDRAYIGNTWGQKLHIFDRIGGLWQQTDLITHMDIGFANAAFSRVEVEDDVMVVSHGPNSPVHVLEFDGTTWNLAATLESLPPGQFATNTPIAITGGTILVGSEFESSASGSVHVFEKVGGAWQRVQLIRASDPTTFARFGKSVAAEGDRLVVGAHGDDEAAINAGAAYLFERQGGLWQEVLKATSAQAYQSARMGSEVAISGRELFADSTPKFGFGRVHVFTLPSEIGTAFGQVPSNSTGFPASLEATGSAAIDHDCLTLAAAGMPPGRFGYFLMSRSQGFVPLFGGSQGNLHLALPIVRFSGDVLLVDAAGEASFSPDLDALPEATVFLPGDTWNFQMWFRDMNPAVTSNTTNGLAITFETAGDPAVQFPVTLVSQVEETVQLAVTVTLSQPAGHDVTIPYTTGGTGTYGVDWRVEEPNPIVIPAGETAYEMTVLVAEDTEQESDETAVITLGAPAGGVLGTAPTLTLTLVDDD